MIFMNAIERVNKTLLNRDRDINERLTIVFVKMGVISGLVGVLICLLAHVPLVGTLLTLAISLLVWITDFLMGISEHKSMFSNLLAIGVSLFIPAIYLTCGGISSGVMVWFVFGLFFVTMAHRGKGLFKYLALCVICQLIAIGAEWYFYDSIFHFEDTYYQRISVIGSMLDVGLTISITVLIMLRLYSYEWEYANARTNELSQVNEKLENAYQSQKAFLANMSHEIRTPINGIMGMNELILREADDPTILEFSQNIADSGTLLLSLVNDILDFSRIEAGKLVLSPEQYSLSDITKEILVLLRPRAEDKDLELKVDIDKDIPDELYGDSNRVKQILINLLGNAIKYTERGTVSLKLHYEDQDEENIRLYFTVKDTGCGIKEEDRKSLFKSFERVDLNKNRNIEGAGLGLAITYSIVLMMDGEIGVNSVYGIGSSFSGYVVQKRIGKKKIGIFTENRNNRDEKEIIPHKGGFTAPNARVLLVDDNRINLLVERKLLESTQMQVVAVENGEEAIEMVSSTHFDILLLDHMMPGMDGIELLKHIRENHLADDTPAIVLTANAINGAKEKYLEEGFDDYLSKPVEGMKLEAMILKYLPQTLVVK